MIIYVKVDKVYMQSITSLEKKEIKPIFTKNTILEKIAIKLNK